LKGLEYMHNTHFLMHRVSAINHLTCLKDLTSSNVMIAADGCVKLIDFGLTKGYGTPEREHSINITTKAYRAPEILFGARHYGPAIDMWAAGCILGELLLREILFPGTTDIDQLGKIFTIRGTPTVSAHTFC
jgi:cyclin-dependent kinase 7